MKREPRPTPSAEDGRELRIHVSPGVTVSGLLLIPPKATCLYLLAHGAGAGMRHPFMSSVAHGLAAREIATLRYQFRYMDQGSRRPDPPKVAHATVRAAVLAARDAMPRFPLLAGGKSYGGRMTSQAQAETALPGVVGLAFFGFPLHPAGQPSVERAEHLSSIRVPMLFIQGSRDALAAPELMAKVLERLRDRATLAEVPGGDHSLHVPARSGRNDQEVLDTALDAFRVWASRVAEMSWG